MGQFTSKYLLLFLLIFGLNCFHIKAQNNFRVLPESSINLNINSSERFSYDFGLASRNYAYRNNEFDLQGIHLELSHMTNYRLNENSGLGLGFKYRFKKFFNQSKSDEKRIVEQYKWANSFAKFKLSQKITLEERFRARTSFRTRYAVSAIFLLSEPEKPHPYTLNLGTEALWHIGAYMPATYDQRLHLSFTKYFSRYIDATLGFEYRYEDYTHIHVNDLYIHTQLQISI